MILEKFCPDCRTLLPKQANYCMDCGNAIPADAPSASSYAYWSQAPEKEVLKIYHASCNLRFVSLLVLLIPLLMVIGSTSRSSASACNEEGVVSFLVMFFGTFGLFSLIIAFGRNPLCQLLILLGAGMGIVGGISGSIKALEQASSLAYYLGAGTPLFIFVLLFLCALNKKIFIRTAPRHRQLHFLVKSASRDKVLSEPEWNRMGMWYYNLYSCPAIVFYFYILLIAAIIVLVEGAQHGQLPTPEAGDSACAASETFPAKEASAPTMEQNTQIPYKAKKLLSGVYSAQSDGEFPGLKLYDTDFLVPLNRMTISGHSIIEDPKGAYGSGGAPMNAIVFGIRDKNDVHYFLTSTPQHQAFRDCIYLGKNISVEQKDHHDCWYMLTYKDGRGKLGRGCVMSALYGPDCPVKEYGIAHPMLLDPQIRRADNCDPFVWKVNAEQLLKLYQDAVRSSDKAAVAKMYAFPVECGGEMLYTRAEFVEKFDELFPPERKKRILDARPEEIFYSWRGALLPCGEWLEAAYSAKVPAGPLNGNVWRDNVGRK